MKLTFVGTRGEIDERTELHGMHTALLVEYRRTRVMIDCGADWLGRFSALKPQAIVLTHGHPDHAWGLREGADCPVCATAETWANLASFPIEQRHEVPPRTPFKVGAISFEAFPVQHSIRCPAVGYRITAGRATALYCPDVVYIIDKDQALEGLDLYIGDGATMETSFVRKRGEALIGHSPVRTQVGWCAKARVPWMIVSHCGKEITAADPVATEARLTTWAAKYGVPRADIAHDGLTVTLR